MKIVVLDGYTLNPGDISWQALEQLGELVVFDRTPVEKVVERATGATMLFTNKAIVNRQHLQQLPNLKYIGVLATGYNIVDVEAANEQGIVVSNVPGYGTPSVVQLTFALLFELCLHVQRHSDAVFEGRWVSSADFSFWDFPLIELQNKTFGIIGFGDIGKKVAEVATAFGMNIMAHSRTQTDQSHRTNFEWVTLENLFKNADVVSIHCPLSPETAGLVNAKNLALMKPTSFFINTSRGPIVVEQHLADALNNGTIAGAAVDVLSTEPPVANNPLLSAKNCLITPHIAWATKEARMRLLDIAVDNARAFLNGEPANEVLIKK